MVTGQVEMQVQETVGGGKTMAGQSRPLSPRHTSDTSLFALLLRDRSTPGTEQPTAKSPELERRNLEGRERFATESLRNIGSPPDELNPVTAPSMDVTTVQRSVAGRLNSVLSAGQAFGENNPAATLTLRTAISQKVDTLQATDPSGELRGSRMKSLEPAVASGNPYPIAQGSSVLNGQEYGVVGRQTVNGGANRRRSQDAAAQKETASLPVDGKENNNALPVAVAGEPVSAIVKPVLAAVIPGIVPPTSAVVRKGKGAGAAVTVSKQANAAGAIWGKPTQAKSSVQSAEKPIMKERVRIPKGSLDSAASVAVVPTTVTSEVMALHTMAGEVLSAVAARQENALPVQNAPSVSTETTILSQNIAAAPRQEVSSVSSAAVSGQSVSSPVSVVPTAVAPGVVTPEAPVVTTVATATVAPSAFREEFARSVRNVASFAAETATRPQAVAPALQQVGTSAPTMAFSAPAVLSPVSVASAAVAPEVVASEAPAVGNVATATVTPSAPRQESATPVRSAPSVITETTIRPQAVASAPQQAVTSAPIAAVSEPVASSPVSVASAAVAPEVVAIEAPAVSNVPTATVAPSAVRQESATPVRSAPSVITETTILPRVVASAPQQAETSAPIAAASEPVASSPVSVASATVTPEVVASEAPAVGNVATATVAPSAPRQEVASSVQSAPATITETTIRPQVVAVAPQQAVTSAPTAASSEPVVSSSAPVASAAVASETVTIEAPAVGNVPTATVAPSAPRQESATPVQGAPSVITETTIRPQAVASAPQQAVTSAPIAAAGEPVASSPVSVASATVAPAAVTIEAPVVGNVATATVAPSASRQESATPVRSVASFAVETAIQPRVVASAPQHAVTSAPIAAVSEPVASSPVSVASAAVAPETVISEAPAATTVSGATVKYDNSDARTTLPDAVIAGKEKGNLLDGPQMALANEPQNAQVNLKAENTIGEINVAQLKPVASVVKTARKGIAVDNDDRNTAPTQGATADDGKLTSAKVDVTFAKSSSGDSSPSEGKDQPGSQSKRKEQIPVQAFNMAVPHVVESRETVPTSAPSSPDEVRNALKESIFSQVKHAEPIHDGKGTSSISLKLNPEDLGELTINVRVEQQRLKVEVISENRSVREALMNNMEGLKETLLKQNFTMERFDVSTGANGNSSNQAFTGDTGEQRNNAPRQFARQAELTALPESKGAKADEDGDESLVNVRA